MKNFLDHQSYYLVGIKGVAMTSLAQLLIDAGKTVRGSDVKDNFVTADLLKQLDVTIDQGFESELPQETDCLIYTAAHQGLQNKQVQTAKALGIPHLSQAEALAYFFNQKQGIAVCGVGGKSTISAMITWILENTGHAPSFSVGVGNINGLGKTGVWNPASEYFVAEADEYVIDPTAAQRGETITPRFSFLKPYLTVSSNILWDHPDVYQNYEQTLHAFQAFFQNIDHQGCLIHPSNPDYLSIPTSARTRLTYGADASATYQYVYLTQSSVEGKTYALIKYEDEEVPLELIVPGEFNVFNATAALAACHYLGIPLDAGAESLASFNSTMRRFEQIGIKAGVTYYDDYAHHPHEIKAAVAALNDWFPSSRKVVAFQPHTYSRTKELFDKFIESFAEAQEIILLDIFASAREAKDETVSSQHLAEAISQRFPNKSVLLLSQPSDLALYCQTELSEGSVLLTLGAGDIYTAHNNI
jgi:UDP-N-acetylmuramate--alanine ligase